MDAKRKPVNNLGFGDNKVEVPCSMEEMIGLLAQVMAHSINNTIEPDNAKMALNAATRIIEATQADTRMKALAIAANRQIDSQVGKWSLLTTEEKEVVAA